jgi:hypothetical protein
MCEYDDDHRYTDICSSYVLIKMQQDMNDVPKHEHDTTGFIIRSTLKGEKNTPRQHIATTFFF